MYKVANELVKTVANEKLKCGLDTITALEEKNVRRRCVSV